jgi:hypothetical protein
MAHYDGQRLVTQPVVWALFIVVSETESKCIVHNLQACNESLSESIQEKAHSSRRIKQECTSFNKDAQEASYVIKPVMRCTIP